MDDFEKSVRVGELEPMKVSVLQKVLSTLKASEDITPEAYRATEEAIKDMYFAAIDEHHARTSGLKRLNRAGYDQDMVRSFLSHARSEANFLSNLKYGGEVNRLFYAMQREAKVADGGARQGKRDYQGVFNVFASHYASNLDSKETPWQDRLMAGTSAWQLATSPAYHLANFMQPVAVTVPRLAADFNDYTGAWSALMAGYKVFADSGGFKFNFNIATVGSDGLRKALQYAKDMGVLETGMDEDLANFNKFRTGVPTVDKASVATSNALRLLRKVSRGVEVANRVSAGSAAYRMAIEHGQTQAEAQQYVLRILQTTQGDSTRSNAPLILKQLPKAVGQYRKFQLMMAAVYAQGFRQAFLSEDKVTKAIGKRMLAYKLFHTTMGAGVMGWPMMSLVAAVFSALGGNDEPEDLERSLRDAIGDETVANLLLHGPLAMIGLDMSAKLGDDKIFSIMPYGTWDITSKTGLVNTAAGLLGPGAAQVLKFAGGLEYMKNDEYYKGVEQLMPKGVADAMKAFRIANEGFTLKNGDVMFKPEDINGLALVMDGLGMSTSGMKRMEWVRSQQYEIGRFYADRTREIQQKYADAEPSERAELIEEWLSLQQGKDNMRKFFGDSSDSLKRQPVSNLIKYAKLKKEREKKLQKSAALAN